MGNLVQRESVHIGRRLSYQKVRSWNSVDIRFFYSLSGPVFETERGKKARESSSELPRIGLQDWV
uniref:Uncharacterized protein n=1 Tax=Nelumbo nucifera TaxID=4432 RepID=A0A822Y438_NELNU|nr:TPA_asm: hypothetical protein HUJ06_028665 [Nelumbo nucifera]